MTKDIMLFVLFLAVLLLCAWRLVNIWREFLITKKPVVKDFCTFGKYFL